MPHNCEWLAVNSHLLLLFVVTLNRFLLALCVGPPLTYIVPCLKVVNIRLDVTRDLFQNVQIVLVLHFYELLTQ